jgi:Arc/MetJ-type ribon-helix-helix transcriptional regulator
MPTVPVPTRFDEHELAAIDELVAAGVAGTRSEVIRVAVSELHDRHARAAVGAAIAEAYRRTPETPDDDALAMANANALTEAEPW